MARPTPALSSQPARPSLRHRIEDGMSAAILGTARLLPYRWRVPAMGWFSRTVLGPLYMTRRIRANLSHAKPDLPETEIRRIERQVADNFGRSLIELFSGAEFARFAAAQQITGPGLADLDKANADGRPVILLSAHFGNYDAWRAGLSARGFRVGGLYKRMSNPAANRRYVAVIESIAKPLFPRGQEGMAAMIRFLKSGGMLGILNDLHVSNGESLDFLGKPALTATSAARMALKYDALLVPVYATRLDDGLNFIIDVESPIAHSDALTMTRALNDSLAARIEKDPGQWFWLHNRWKNTPGGPGTD